MKRTSYPRFLARAAMTLLAVLCFLGARAQETVTIGDGTSAGYYTPINTYYNYSITEQLYTADEIGMAGNISSISFYYAHTDVNKEYDITVYMQNVDAADLSTGISLADADEVFSGTISITEQGWVTIDLDTPFAYDGTSNLLIGINKTGGSQWFSGATWQYTSATNMARYSQKDATPAYDISTVPGSTTAYRPNIQIVITPSSGPTCGKPDELTANGAPTAYEFSFNIVGGSGLYNIETKPSIGTDPIIEDWTAYDEDVNQTTITLTDLIPGKAYQVRVQSICTDITDPETGEAMLSGWKTLSFTTPEVCPDGKVCIGEGTATNSYLPSNNYYKQSLTQQIYTAEEIGEEGFILSLDLFKASTNEMVRNLDIYIVSTDKNEFESTSDWIPVTAKDLVFSGEVTFTDKDWTTIEFDNPFDYNGESNIAIVIDDNTGSYVSTTPFYAFTAEKNQALYYCSDSNNLDPTTELTTTGYLTTAKNRVRLAIGEPPSCLKPTGLTVNYTEGITATVTWEGEATSYNIDVNGEVTEGVTSPYTLEDLELGTDYEIKVQADCGGDDTSDWTNPVTFTTDNCMPEDMIAVNYTLNDSYGDGWTGNYILVIDENCEIADFVTLESGATASGTIKICGSYAQFVWYVSGSYTYPGETSWTFTDADGNELFAGAGGDVASGDVLYTIDKNPYPVPSDFAVDNVGPHSAELSWTENGTATAWEIGFLDDDGNVVNTVTADSNPFTLTDLDAETAYTITVRSTGANGTSLWNCYSVTFNTTTATPVPTDLVANRINATSATLNWEGFASEYNVRYGQETDADPSAPATIILTAPDVWSDGSGYQMLLDADATAYGTIIPETGGLTSSGDASEETYAEFEYKIPGNADGSLTTNNIVFNNSVSIQIPAGTYDWCITNPSPGDRVWIASSNGPVPGRYDDFVFEPGVTYEFTISMYGSNDGVDCTITPPMEWTTVEGVTSPYQLTDLDPSTEYYWQVQGNYGEEGLSSWSSTSTFTTGSFSDAPTELAATATSSTATLEWTGSQRSYNVRYRVKSHGDELAVHNFDESDMGEWTTIDADGDGYDWILATESAGVYHNAGVDLSGLGHNDSNDFLISGSYSNVVGALTPDNYLVSPQVDLGGSISFYAQAQDASYAAEHFGVAVSTAGNTDAADFTTIKEWTMNADGTGTEGSKAGEWGLFTVDLSDYAGQQGYVAIRHFGCTDQFILNIDDIVIEGPAGAETEWTELTVSDNSIEIDGLESNTEYEWQVQGILDEGTTNWTIGDNFTTLPLIELANDATDNSALINDFVANNDPAVADVTLTGRTLFKDGSWNTICLPFDLTLEEEGSPLKGATAKELTGATMTGTYVTLTFGFVDNLKAGVPYIIKWEEPAEALSEPTFTGRTIKDVPEATRTVSFADGNVKFIGYYDAFPITAADENIYYMTADNTLKHTKNARTLKSCRAYFDFTAANGKKFILDFGDGEVTGITDIDMDTNASGWYTVDGKKLDKQPTRKGVYINNGVKVVIK